MSHILKILLVEADVAQQHHILQCLSDEDWGEKLIQTANSLQEAVESTANFIPSAVMLNLNLPDSKGLETYRKFRQLFPSLPCILLTNSSDRALGITLLHEGADDFLTPDQLTTETIEKSLSFAIERSSLKSQLQSLSDELKFHVGILDHIQDIVLVIDRFGAVEFVNSVVRLVLGYEPKELLDENWWELVFVTKKQGKDAKKRLLGPRARFQQLEYELISKRKQHLQFTVSQSFHFNHSQVLVFHDITLRKRADLELAVKQADLENLLYRLSHDLKAPVSTFEGLLNAVKATKCDGVADLVELMATNLDRQKQLLTNFQAISHLHQYQLSNHRCDLQRLPFGVTKLLVDKPNYKRESIIWKIETTVPKVVLDIGLLTQLVAHLLENALLYQRSKTIEPVLVVIEEKDSSIWITISDKGIGIPKRLLPHVFKLFFKGDMHSTGPGFGLYLSKLITEKMNGTIHLESEKGEGTIVSMVLPVER